MPNWCTNHLIIEGSDDKIQIIKDKLNENPNTGIFFTLIGREPNVTKEEYDNGGWYGSNINYWGCKWDIGRETHIDFYDDLIIMNFDTAWSPPIPFCRTLSNMYDVSVRLEFSESGNFFAGYYEIDEEGNEVEESRDYYEGLFITDEEQFWMELESDLEYNVENNEEVNDFIKDNLSFLTENNKNRVIDIWENIKQLNN
jgi:hypothetical protein